MSDKIKAIFGADVSEVEAKMIVATRATKSYENAVRGLAKNDGSKGSAIETISGKIPQAIEGVRNLSGGLGQAISGAARLASGFGPVGLAVSGVVSAGIGIYNFIDSANKKAADLRDKFREISRASVEIARADAESLMNAEEKAKAQADVVKKRKDEWLTLAKIGDDDLAISQAKLDYDKAISKQKALDAEADKERAAKKIADIQDEFSKKIYAAEQQAKIDDFIADKEKKKADDQLKRDKEIADAREKLANEEKASASENAQMRYDWAWKNASNEQRLAVAQMEGAIALENYKLNASEKNLLELNKAREKWLGVKREIDEAKQAASSDAKSKDTLATNGRTRNEKGQLVRNGVVISEEDAARADETRARNKVTEQNKGKVPADILERIEALLKPKGVQ